MKVLLLGDSHTHGSYGQALEALFRQTGHEVVRVGRVSATARSYLVPGAWKKLNMGGTGDFDQAAAGTYDLAIVTLGTNDAAGMGANAASTAKSIKALTDGLKASQVWWVGPPAFSAEAAATYNPVFKAENLNARSERLWRAAAPLYGDKAIDPREATRAFAPQKDIHFRADGGKAWAAFVYEQVRRGKTSASGASLSPQVVVGGLLLVVAVCWFAMKGRA